MRPACLWCVLSARGWFAKPLPNGICPNALAGDYSPDYATLVCPLSAARKEGREKLCFHLDNTNIARNQIVNGDAVLSVAVLSVAVLPHSALSKGEGCPAHGHCRRLFEK